MKKLFLLIVLLFQLSLVFGQNVGSIVKSKTIYNSSGIVVSYSITYYGVGDCRNNTNGGLKKYRIDFNARNNSNLTVKLVGSRVDLDDNLGSQHYCRSGIYILFGSYPGFEDFGTLVPNESVNATEYVYMLQNSTDLPYITSNIIPIIQKELQTQNQQQPNSNRSTNNSQNNYNNQFIQQALSEFNQLLPKVPDGTAKKNIYNNVQNVLNGNYSEQGKLNVLNDAILKFKNLIAQGKSNISNSNNFKDLQNRQLELVKQIKAIEPNANVGVYEGNIGENETLSIQRSKENINHLEKWLERIKPNSNNKLTELSTPNQISKSVQTQSQSNQVINTQQNTEIQQQQSLADFNSTIKDFMQSIPNVQESRETLDKMKNFELAKLDIEPEFNIISSAIDYNKVSLTTINYQNLDKKGNVAVSIITSALSNVDKAKDKAFISAKIQTAFLGANTLLVKVIEIGGKTLGGPYTYPTTDVFGIAYSDKKVNFEMLKQFIENNKDIKIAKCLSHKVNSNDIKTEKCGKAIIISELTKKDEKIKLTASIDGIEETYTVINFNSKGFTLMKKVEEDSKRAILYNYIIEIQ